MKDYYAILELAAEASQDDIQKQWRFFVQAWHPDKFAHPDHKRRAEEKFKELTEAYEVLRDPQRRQVYNARRAEEDRQRLAQAERLEKERQREELRTQEGAARRYAREEQHREHLQVAWRRAAVERPYMTQAKAQSHVVLVWLKYVFFILVLVGLFVYLYTWMLEDDAHVPKDFTPHGNPQRSSAPERPTLRW